MDSQLNSFIYGLQPRTPEQAVELWILGVENRSGAVQYAVLPPSLQRKLLGDWAPYWTNWFVTKIITM